MSHLIVPLSQVYGTGTACCQSALGGRTPAEYSGGAATESPSNTWDTSDIDASIGFKVCCKQSCSLAFTYNGSDADTAVVLLNGVFYDEVLDTESPKTINVTMPDRVCGNTIEIDYQGEWTIVLAL